MSAKAVDSDFYKAVCRKCFLDDCVADLGRRQAIKAGCPLAPMLTPMKWQAITYYSHEESPTGELHGGLSEQTLHLKETDYNA